MKKKAIISIFATVFLALTLTLFSYAATKTQDGLQVELTTDKSSYTSSDTISVTVKVTNTGTTAVLDLTLENTIPMGYTKTTNTSSTKNVSILFAGDEAMLTTSFVKDGSATENTSGGMSGGLSASDVGDDSSDGTSLNEGESATSESAAISENENAYETVAGVEGSDIDGSSTGDGGVSPVAIAVGVIVVVGIAVAIVKIKSGKKLLSILICVSVVSAFDGEMMLTVMADEYAAILISENITVDGSSVSVRANVKYSDTSGEGLSLPETPTDDEKEVWNDYKVKNVCNASESTNAFSERDIIVALQERGFDNLSIIYMWSMDGEWLSDTEASAESNTKRPQYWATYYGANKSVWILHIVNDCIYANLLTHDVTINNKDYGVFVSESEYIVGYMPYSGNQFYEIEPYSSYAVVKKVDRITKEVLDEFSVEEILR